MFLVGTSDSLLYVREDGVITPIDSGKGSYTGIEKFFGRYYISTNNDRTEYKSDILVLDKKLRLDSIEEPSDFAIEKITDLTFWKGELICSAEDRLILFDGENWKEWTPIKQKFKSTCVYNNQLHILTGSDMILVYDDIGSSLVSHMHYNVGLMCYNLMEYDDEIYTLSAQDGTVRSLNEFEKNLGERNLKGLTFSNDNFWVGSSRGVIIQYDFDWNKVKEIELDSGEVHCITTIGAKASNPQLRMIS
tara:strand:+ start:15749 stop:16492 length:744 start_codon:yes stop_codon:yes gene_type:complete